MLAAVAKRFNAGVAGTMGADVVVRRERLIRLNLLLQSFAV